jgi:integrase
MKSMTQQELDLFLTTVAKHSEQEELMFRVMFNHGLRITEALTLDKTNVQGDYLIVQRLKGSRKTTQRLTPDEKEVLQALAKVEGRFFPYNRKTIWRHMQEYCREAGIPLFKAHPHAIKHTTGKLARKAGLEVEEIQAVLGHVNGGNTLVYMQADEEEAFDKFLAGRKK